MALASWKKLLSEQVAYFKNWKFNFQKTRVIGALNSIDEALERYSKSTVLPRINRGETFYIEKARGDDMAHPHALFYEEALFLNHIIKRWKFDTSKLSKFEQEDYNRAVEKLQEWEKLNNLMTELKHFVKEIKQVIGIRRAVHSTEQSIKMGYPLFEESIVNRYKKLLEELEEFPEWKQKVINEVEPNINLLADQTNEASEELEESPFKEMDQHKYFK
mmetsp:Transcript_11084/g.16478  ORF Transcript_11084/g.16478 Transcript_11084/m.16478 type:complete len:218 (+) Transcript_11084:13-666(+)